MPESSPAARLAAMPCNHCVDGQYLPWGVGGRLRCSHCREFKNTRSTSQANAAPVDAARLAAKVRKIPCPTFETRSPVDAYLMGLDAAASLILSDAERPAPAGGQTFEEWANDVRPDINVEPYERHTNAIAYAAGWNAALRATAPADGNVVLPVQDGGIYLAPSVPAPAEVPAQADPAAIDHLNSAEEALRDIRERVEHCGGGPDKLNAEVKAICNGYWKRKTASTKGNNG